jgi:hypothetical protein
MSPSKRSRTKLVLTICFALIAMALFACEDGTGDSAYPGPVSSPNTNVDEVTYPDDKTDEIPLPHGGEVTYPDDKTDEIPLPQGDTDAQESPPSPWQPTSGDDKLIRGEAFVNQSQILVLESFPPQFMLNVAGALPTPCHELRVEISDPDEQNRIYIEVYSVSEPDEICVQVLESFDESVPLEGFPSGEYSVWVNGEEVGEINPP